MYTIWQTDEINANQTLKTKQCQMERQQQIQTLGY